VEPREILLEYLLSSTSIAGRDAFIQTLKTAFNPKDGLGLLTLGMDGSIDRSIWCVPLGEPECLPAAGRRPFRQLVQVRLRAPWPHFFDPEINTVTLASFAGGLAFPWSTPWTFGTASTTITITNAGNVATPVIVTFNGDITNPRIDNLTTGKYIKATMALAAGEALRINTAPGEHTVEYFHGGLNTNGFQYLDSGSEFFWLEPGDNILSFSSSSALGAGSSCNLEYFDQFVGV
jgi:hypothetical protein